MELKERLQKVIDYSKLSVRAFAMKCGIKQPTLFRYLNGGSEPVFSVLYNIIHNYPEISCEWLLMGDGNMLKEDNKDVKRLNSLLDTIENLNETINLQRSRIAELENKLKLK